MMWTSRKPPAQATELRPDSVDSLRSRMLGVGNQLIGALALERTYSQRGAPKQAASESRDRVDNLALAYIEAISRYREAMEDELLLQKSSPARDMRVSARR